MLNISNRVIQVGEFDVLLGLAMLCLVEFATGY